MTQETARLVRLRDLHGRLSPVWLEELLAAALLAGAVDIDLRPAPDPLRVICAAAIQPLFDLDAATREVEHQLEGAGDESGAGASACATFARLAFLGHRALQVHADRNGYRPARRLESIVSVYAPAQVEGVLWFVEAGAGRRCLQACSASSANAIEVAMVEAATEDPPFVEAAAAWTGISLALYAIACSTVG